MASQPPPVTKFPFASPALKYFKSASGSTSHFLFFSFFHLALLGLSLWHKDHNFPGETTVVVGWIELSRRPKVGNISCFFLQGTRVDWGVAKKEKEALTKYIFFFLFFVPKRGADSRREKKEINCQINQKANFPSSPLPPLVPLVAF